MQIKYTCMHEGSSNIFITSTREEERTKKRALQNSGQLKETLTHKHTKKGLNKSKSSLFFILTLWYTLEYSMCCLLTLLLANKENILRT